MQTTDIDRPAVSTPDLSASSDEPVPTQASSGPTLTPGQALRRRWWIAVVLVPLLTAAGILWALSIPRVYTGEVRLAVGPAEMSTGAVTGFPLAARDLAADYARWVQNGAADPSRIPAGVTSITGSPIPDSAVIRVEVTAGSPDQARTGVAKVASDLVAAVNTTRSEINPKTAYTRYQALMPKVAAADVEVRRLEAQYGNLVGGKAKAAAIRTSGTALVAAKVALAKAQIDRDAASDLYRRLAAEASTASDLRVVQAAYVSKDDGFSSMQRFGLVGFVVGLAVALGCAMLLARRDAT